MRVAGQLIWATHFEEEQVTTTQPTGGDVPPKQKGGKGSATATAGGSGSQGGTVTAIEYRYYANLAFALCEGDHRHRAHLG